MKKFYSLIFLISVALIANAQSIKDTSAAFRLIRNNEVIIGIYDSPNLTFVKPQMVNDGGYFPGNGAITSHAALGYNRSINAKLKFREGLFCGTGFSFSMQSYLLSQIGGSDSLTYTHYLFSSYFNNDQYTCTFKNYYASIPLTIGYSFTHEGWSNYIDIGVEFYYNYMNSESMMDDTKGKFLEQETFYNGRPNQYSWYSFGLLNYNWGTLGVFGVLNAGFSYHISPKFSAAFESTLRFTNPFAANPIEEPFSAIRGLANLSLNLGLTYSFQIEDIGSFKTIEKDNDSKGLMIGFNIIPNYYIYPSSQNSGGVKGFTFSYEFPMQFNLSKKLALKTGIVIDNFTDNYINDIYILGFLHYSSITFHIKRTIILFILAQVFI